MEEKIFEFIVPPKQKLQTNKIALIDADFIKYLVIYSIQQDIEKKNAVIYENSVHKYTKERLDNIFSRFDCKSYLFCFSGVSDETFRTHVSFDKKYKGNRSYAPLYENQEEDKKEVVKYIRERYPSLIFRDLEADDLLSMLQDEDTFIFSNDKDLLQIPGTHYHIKEERFYEQSKEDAFVFLMKQLITGDSVDNISGLKSYGPAKSEKLLTNIPSQQMHLVVLQEYVKTNGLFNGIDMFVETWNMIRLRNKRGEHFIKKYQSAFDLLRMLKL